MKANLVVIVSLIFGSSLFVSCKQTGSDNLTKELETVFVNPPDSIQTSVYWYWISDNISKEGVENDLISMKKAGINRAFIGYIGQDDVPYGNVKIFSNEWWDILHAALKKATELDIEIGIFNSPGWSQSGGPWVRPNEAMRYLASSELHVKGPQKLSQKLENPVEHFQDVKVIAYPEPKFFDQVFDSKTGSISSLPKAAGLSKLTDKNTTTGMNFPADGDFILDYEAQKPFTARSLSIVPLESGINNPAVLQVKESNGTYRTISEFQIDRFNAALNVGFNPFAPVVVSFAPVTATSFRVIVKNINAEMGLAEVELSSAARVERYPEKTLAKMFQTPLPYWKDYQWRQQPEPGEKDALIDASQVIDLSLRLSADGTLNWEVPEGNWVILRTGMTPTGVTNAPASPEATGLEIDKMSKKHVEKHFYAYIGEIMKRIPEADRKTFKVVVQDSYETGGQNFTDDFLNEFKERYGYDPLPFLPVYNGFVVNSQLESDRFLWDIRRMVADKVAYDYVGGLRDVSHKHGLKTWLECYGHWGFPSEFLMYGGQSDEIGGEYWSEGELGDIENRAATSCGHIYGKTKISAESNTVAGGSFSRYPARFKQRTDRFFAEGINNTLLHVYISQPYEDKNPGVNAWFGNEFNRKNIWFEQMDVFVDYLKRSNYMLQQGLNVADAAYFIGEDVPKMTGITDPELPVGYQYDYMNAEVIEKNMTVKDGLLTLPHGTQYRILVLPKLETMRPELLAKIKQLVNDGAVVLGPAPTRSPSQQNQPEADQQVAKMAAELWGDVDGVNLKTRKVGKGLIMNGLSMTETFALINCVPDCKLPEDRSVHFGHRTLSGAEVYFVSNQTEETKLVTPEFRISGYQPELWDATTGKIRELPAFEQFKNTTSVPLKLAPLESVFIVFRKKAGKARTQNIDANYPKATILADLNQDWKVQFDESQRGPKEPVTFNTLIDWTQSADDQIKYYSGSASYQKTFNINALPVDKRILISLGDLTAMAKVYLNDEYVGGVWTPPYQLDITDFIEAGKNTLRIDVVNTWKNRLIGDLKLPESQRETWCPVNEYNADSPLQASGLFGPVTISSLIY